MNNYKQNKKEEFKNLESKNNNITSFMDFISNLFDSEDLKLEVEFIKKTNNFFNKLMGLSIYNNLSNTQYAKLINYISICESDIDDFIEDYNLKTEED